MELEKPTRLVISGGGAKGVAILGSLHYLHENDYLKEVEEYWGTSVGSLISLLLIIGYTPFEAYHEFFMQDNFINHLETTTFHEKGALCPIEIFGEKIKKFIEKKLGAENNNPTFLDLYTKFDKKLNIIGSNTDKMEGTCFNVWKYPTMRVIDAIEISCDLPFIFTKKEWEGEVYVDGSFINNYPINLADDGINPCLGICVVGDMKPSFGNDYIGWIYRLVHMPIKELYRERVKAISAKTIHVELSVNYISLLELSPSKKKKIQMFSDGYKQTLEIITKLENRKQEYIQAVTYTLEDWQSDILELQDQESSQP